MSSKTIVTLDKPLQERVIRILDLIIEELEEHKKRRIEYEARCKEEKSSCQE